MEQGIIYEVLNSTAWRMDAPALFGGFHVAASLIAILAAALAAFFTARRMTENGQITDRNLRRERLVRVLSVTGWILVLLEAYKQLFLYHIVNNGAYDWWYFPFQLCSVPMYLCILLPLMGKRQQRTYLTFMSGYTFISALAALIYPEDILRPYVTLTLHGFIWHGVLLFISLVIVMSDPDDISARAIARAAGSFAILCVIAVIINMAAEPVMQAAHAAHAVPHSYAAMFYMNPYHLSDQPLVSSVQETAGIPAGLILYALAIAAAGSLTSFLMSRRSLHK